MIRFSTSVKARFRGMVDQIMESGQLSGGPFTEGFERRWRDHECGGVGTVVATSNGTTALELAIRYARCTSGVPPSSLVAIPEYAPPMLRWAVRQAGYTPVLYDAGVNMVPTLETIAPIIAMRPRAIIYVATGGMVDDSLPAIQNAAILAKIPLIGDLSHAHLGQYAACKLPAYFDACAWSFYATKTFGVGEGGAVWFSFLSDSPAAYANQGKPRGSGIFGPVGYNLRPSEFSAALMLALAEHGSQIYKDRQYRANRLIAAGVFPITMDVESLRTGYYKFMVRVGDADVVTAAAKEAGVRLTGRVYGPEYFGGTGIRFENTRELINGHICPDLPTADDDDEYIERLATILR